MGPQNGEPYCPCLMNRLNIVKRNGRWVEPEKDLGEVIEPIDTGVDKWDGKKMPFSQKPPCLDMAHNVPTHLYIPPGTTYTHTCPSCGKVQEISPPNITFGVPDESVVAPEFDITTESFEPYSFSTEEDEDAFAAESDAEIKKSLKLN